MLLHPKIINPTPLSLIRLVLCSSFHNLYTKYINSSTIWNQCSCSANAWPFAYSVKNYLHLVISMQILEGRKSNVFAPRVLGRPGLDKPERSPFLCGTEEYDTKGKGYQLECNSKNRILHVIVQTMGTNCFLSRK